MKLSYKKALELKKAGFPLTECSNPGNCDIDFIEVPEKGQPYLHKPTLSELIEACGDFITLFQGDGYWGCVKSKESPLQKNDDGTHRLVFDCLGNGTGSTPDEAVTNLWLATRKK